MKNKIKLYLVGNNKEFNHYIIDKKNEVVKQLSHIFKEIFNIYWKQSIETHDKRNNWKQREINFENNNDFQQLIGENKNSRIDVFYGNKKMYILIHASKNLKKRFNEELLKITKMPKPKKSKK